MAHSQYKCYKVFAVGQTVEAPYVEVMILSNGEKIGKAVSETILPDSLSNEDITLYINANHTTQPE